MHRLKLKKTEGFTLTELMVSMSIGMVMDIAVFKALKKTPEAVALFLDTDALSYGDLNRRANQLAHFLRELGVRPDARVAICLERGFEMIVALLAVLKAGGAYVPLDPTYPLERLRFMLEDSAPVALLTQGHLRELFAGLSESLPVLEMAEKEALWRDQSDSNLDPASIALSSHHLAYVIYTSGSTGTPKGVLVEHRGLCNLTIVHAEYLTIDANSRVLQFASFSFDGFAFELVMALGQGASLHLSPQDQKLVGETLTRVLTQHSITHAILPPAVLVL